jgi:hypothetical protein
MNFDMCTLFPSESHALERRPTPTSESNQMALLGIAGLCTFALIAWLLWLEHRKEVCALADPRNGERFSTEDKLRGVSAYLPNANEASRRGSEFAESRGEVGNGY